MYKRLALAALVAMLAACTSTGVEEQVEEARIIPGQYIVVYKDDTAVLSALKGLQAAQGRVSLQSVQGLGLEAGSTVQHVYTSALLGVAVSLSDQAVAQLKQDPRVAFVEPDQWMEASTAQTGATWGLDRVDQRNLPLSTTYSYTADGSGVSAYVIDTGIRTSHTEFSGRASVGFDSIGDGKNGQDCNGHGTHVAGTVGGSTYGVAKNVNLIAVRVLSCSGSGSNSGVIAGVDWVRQNAVKPAVANMSLGGGASTALDNAVTNAINSGVVFAVAAGNSNANACNYSPARAAAAITVGATTSADARASYSNYGSCLDIFAPGSAITSSWIDSDSAIKTINGTSMATPHVAGVSALYLSVNPTATPLTLRNALVNNSTTGKVTSAGRNSPNRLLFSNY